MLGTGMPWILAQVDEIHLALGYPGYCAQVMRFTWLWDALDTVLNWMRCALSMKGMWSSVHNSTGAQVTAQSVSQIQLGICINLTRRGKVAVLE